MINLAYVRVLQVITHLPSLSLSLSLSLFFHILPVNSIIVK